MDEYIKVQEDKFLKHIELHNDISIVADSSKVNVLNKNRLIGFIYTYSYIENEYYLIK